MSPISTRSHALVCLTCISIESSKRVSNARRSVDRRVCGRFGYRSQHYQMKRLALLSGLLLGFFISADCTVRIVAAQPSHATTATDLPSWVKDVGARGAPKSGRVFTEIGRASCRERV